MVGIVVMVGESVYIYALVGINAKSGYRQSDNRRSGKRHSARSILRDECTLISPRILLFVTK